MSDRIFVYGTLLQGESNHRWLGGSRCLGQWTSLPLFTLYDLGDYPAAMAGGGSSLHGEVYEISAVIMSGLDRLEECPEYYGRAQIPTAFGLAWIYLLNQPPENISLIPHGDWVRYRRERNAGI